MRRGKASPPKLFECAKEPVTDLMFKVFYRTITPRFTVNDVVEFCVPSEAVRNTCREAYAVAHEHAQYRNVGMVNLRDYSQPGERMTLSVDFHVAGMLTPNSQYLTANGPDTTGIMDTINQTANLVAQFSKVKKLLTWMDDNRMTPGAARYYWPSILALLPDTHPVYQTDGQRHRETPGVSEVLDLMRETSAIIASALMVGNGDPPPRQGHVTLSIPGLLGRSFKYL